MSPHNKFMINLWIYKSLYSQFTGPLSFNLLEGISGELKTSKVFKIVSNS